MGNLIEPNLHPTIVHFTLAFLITGPILLLIFSFTGKDISWRENIRTAGDWMFALGLVSAIAALAAGFQAYYSVNHDGPSHVAMTDHRNWAIGTIALFSLFGVWRFVRFREPPSKMFTILLLTPVILLGITGWKGGHLVYQYGIGVASLPQVSGDGHDHDHGPVRMEQKKTTIGQLNVPDSDGDQSTHSHADTRTQEGVLTHDEGVDGHHDKNHMSEPTPHVSAKEIQKKAETKKEDHSGHEH